MTTTQLTQIARLISCSAKNIDSIRDSGGGAIILSGGYDRERAEADLQSGAADLVAFGRPFIANPDLVQRLCTGAFLAVPDRTTFYTPGKEGYTDYRKLSDDMV